MYRATTPKHSFIFDVNPEETFKTILITYTQGDQIILEKHKEDLTVEETTGCNDEIAYEAYLRLTQEEANLFNSKSTVSIQVRELTYEGEALAFDKWTVAVKDVLNDEVLT